jgi:hypothetical protein
LSGRLRRGTATARSLNLPIAHCSVALLLRSQVHSTDPQFAAHRQLLFPRDDISVRANHQHELILISDSFQDVSTREAAVSGLRKDPKTLCNLGIWHIKVGYSKGVLSSDVMKTVSLGCSAAKAARIEETRSLREEIANAANDPDGSGRVHTHAVGTTLVVESPYFFDDPTNGPVFAKAMAQKLMEDSQKLCAAAVSQLQMRGSKRVVRSTPVICR